MHGTMHNSSHKFERSLPCRNGALVTHRKAASNAWIHRVAKLFGSRHTVCSRTSLSIHHVSFIASLPHPAVLRKLSRIQGH